MPKPALVLCRGWRGVGAHAAKTLRLWAERDPLALSRVLVLVPTAAAAHLYRRQLEDSLARGRDVLLAPKVATPKTLIEELTERTFGRVRIVDPLLREALLEQSFAEAAEGGHPPPFPIRGGLAPRVLQFYDELLSNGSRLDDFTARALEELDAPDDQGAEKMAAETRFLHASLEAYRHSLEALDLEDPPSARAALLREKIPYDRALVLGSETLSPLDLDFLTRVEGLVELEIAVADESADLSAPLAKAVAEMRVTKVPAPEPPRLLNPIVHVARDREESLVDAARLLKSLDERGARPPLHRIAVVVPKPLPYLYLAKKVFEEAGVAYELQDSFPLATEPYMAAFDLALELVATDAHRRAALALLRSPFFAFDGVGPDEVAAFDALTLRTRETGGAKRWRSLYEWKSRPPEQPALPGLETRDETERVLPALAAILEAVEALAPLSAENPLTEKIACLTVFLETYTCRIPDERHQRTRAAFDSILERLDAAARHVRDPDIGFTTFREKLRRAVEAHTFATRTGRGGVALVDQRDAGFGAFDVVILLGINDGEWPARGERNIFYPQWLLREFGWPSDRELLSRERSRFRALLDLANERLALVRHQLEDEIPTVASPFLEEVESWLEDNPRESEPFEDALEEILVTRSEAQRRGLVSTESTLERKQRRHPGDVGSLLAAPDPVSPTALELYLRCPFKYFSRYLLGLEEEDDVDEMLTPLERGRILHDLLEDGFAAWDRSRERPRPVEPETYEEALALFRTIAVKKIPPEHRSVELSRLFGGPGEPGAIEWLLRREMATGPLDRRLLEYGFQTPLRFERGPSGEKPWFVKVKGRIDRADVDGEGFLHVYDYKSGRAPEAAVTLQVPLYAMCLSQELGAPVKEAAYLSFRNRRKTTRMDYQKASASLIASYGAIQDGRFPPRPQKDSLCSHCGYVGVCRKEIQEVDS